MPRTPRRQAPSVEPDEKRTSARKDARSFADVDESSSESFPASDPPGVGEHARRCTERASQAHGRGSSR